MGGGRERVEVFGLMSRDNRFDALTDRPLP